MLSGPSVFLFEDQLGCCSSIRIAGVISIGRVALDQFLSASVSATRLAYQIGPEPGPIRHPHRAGPSMAWSAIGWGR